MEDDSEKKDVVPMADDEDCINLHDLLAQTSNDVKKYEQDGTDDVKYEPEKPVESRRVGSKPGTSKGSFFCAFCRVHVPATVTQLVIPPQPAFRARARQQLLKKYSISMVDETMEGSGTILVCKRHVVEEKKSVEEKKVAEEEREGSFFCAFCRIHVPATVTQLVIPPQPAFRARARQQLLKKYSTSLVDETMKGIGTILVCKRHVTDEKTVVEKDRVAEEKEALEEDEMVEEKKEKEEERSGVSSNSGCDESNMDCEIGRRGLESEAQATIDDTEFVQKEPPSFFCALCQDRLPGAVVNFVVVPNTDHKEDIRKLLYKKYSIGRVNSCLDQSEPLSLCRRHIQRNNDSSGGNNKTSCCFCGNEEILEKYTTKISTDAQEKLQKRISEDSIPRVRLDEIFVLAKQVDEAGGTLRLCSDHLDVSLSGPTKGNFPALRLGLREPTQRYKPRKRKRMGPKIMTEEERIIRNAGNRLRYKRIRDRECDMKAEERRKCRKIRAHEYRMAKQAQLRNVIDGKADGGVQEEASMIPEKQEKSGVNAPKKRRPSSVVASLRLQKQQRRELRLASEMRLLQERRERTRKRLQRVREIEESNDPRLLYTLTEEYRAERSAATKRSKMRRKRMEEEGVRARETDRKRAGETDGKSAGETDGKRAVELMGKEK